MSDHDQKVKATGMPGVTLRDHVYDGIEEFDQKLPNWWLFTLYITIVLFVIYWVLYYQFGLFQTDEERIDAKIAVIEAERERQLTEQLATLNDKSLWEMSRDPSRVEAGREIFKGKCVACHGPDLTGFLAGVKLPGLPLNDTEWKHGGEPMTVFNIVLNGSPQIETGMIAWKTQMSSADIAKVVSFVLSHHEEGKPWTKAAPAPAGAAPAPAATPPAPAATAPAPAATPPAPAATPPAPVPPSR
jgi:cytochrome c oxidase cbb3-type subunit 3